jgi:FecR protein
MAGTFRCFLLPLAALLAAAPAGAQQVGTATAVNPSTEGTPPGASAITLTVGSRVVHKERIHTSPTGSIQLLFLDKSTLNIAPNTSLVIDEFVYDPASGTGHMLTKLTQGTLQYIGGKLSHEGAVTITTPAATIGIRGGIGTVAHTTIIGTQAFNQNGWMTITNAGGSIVISRPGFVVTILNWNTPPGQPERITKEQVIHYIEWLSSKFAQNGSVPGLKNIDTVNFTCGTFLMPACPQPPWLPTNAGENDALQIIIQSTQRATQTIPPPLPPPILTAPILTNNVRGP